MIDLVFWSGTDYSRQWPAMRSASRVELCQSTGGGVERNRRESICCFGGWVVAKNCTTYFRFHVIAFHFFRKYVQIMLAVVGAL